MSEPQTISNAWMQAERYLWAGGGQVRRRQDIHRLLIQYPAAVAPGTVRAVLGASMMSSWLEPPEIILETAVDRLPDWTTF